MFSAFRIYVVLKFNFLYQARIVVYHSDLSGLIKDTIPTVA